MSARDEVRWQVGRGLPAIEALEKPWNRLARVPRRSPTADATWARCVWRALRGGDDDALHVHSLWEGDRLLAALPLRPTGRLLRGAAALTDMRFTTYCAIAWDETRADVPGRILDHLLRDADLLEVRRLAVDDPLCTGLGRAAQERGLPVVHDPMGGDAWTPLAGRSWDDLRRSMSTKLRKNTERAIRQLGQSGSLEFEVVEDHPRLVELVRECFELESLGWKNERGWTVVSTPDALQFYSDLARACAAEGRLALYLLRVDGKIVAFDYCIRAGGRIDLLKTTYHPELARQSPSNVLRYMVWQHEAERGEVDEYHFGGTSEWKRRWAEQEHPLVQLRIYGRGVRARAARLGPRMRHAVRRNPTLRKLLRPRRRGGSA